VLLLCARARRFQGELMCADLGIIANNNRKFFILFCFVWQTHTHIFSFVCISALYMSAAVAVVGYFISGSFTRTHDHDTLLISFYISIVKVESWRELKKETECRSGLFCFVYFFKCVHFLPIAPCPVLGQLSVWASICVYAERKRRRLPSASSF
jgi:hypothetical protein